MFNPKTPSMAEVLDRRDRRHDERKLALLCVAEIVASLPFTKRHRLAEIIAKVAVEQSTAYIARDVGACVAYHWQRWLEMHPSRFDSDSPTTEYTDSMRQGIKMWLTPSIEGE